MLEEIRLEILSLLGRWSIKVTSRVSVSSVYVIGSVIRKGSGGFVPKRSDVDLLLVLSESSDTAHA